MAVASGPSASEPEIGDSEVKSIQRLCALPAVALMTRFEAERRLTGDQIRLEQVLAQGVCLCTARLMAEANVRPHLTAVCKGRAISMGYEAAKRCIPNDAAQPWYKTRILHTLGEGLRTLLHSLPACRHSVCFTDATSVDSEAEQVAAGLGRAVSICSVEQGRFPMRSVWVCDTASCLRCFAAAASTSTEMRRSP